MDDENNYITHLGSNLGEHDLAKTISDHILQNQREKIRKIYWSIIQIYSNMRTNNHFLLFQHP